MFNYESSTLAGKGVAAPEALAWDEDGTKVIYSLQSAFGFQEATSLHTGKVITYTDAYGKTCHMAIYVLTSRDGTQYYVGRPGGNLPVQLQTSKINDKYYYDCSKAYWQRRISSYMPADWMEPGDEKKETTPAEDLEWFNLH